MGHLYIQEIRVKTSYYQNLYLLAQPIFKQSLTEPMLVTPASIPMSDSIHFHAITGVGKVEKVEEKPPVLRAEEAGGPVLAPSVEVEVIGAAAHFIADLEDELQRPGVQVHSKTDSLSKRKGWFS